MSFPSGLQIVCEGDVCVDICVVCGFVLVPCASCLQLRMEQIGSAVTLCGGCDHLKHRQLFRAAFSKITIAKMFSGTFDCEIKVRISLGLIT